MGKAGNDRKQVMTNHHGLLDCVTVSKKEQKHGMRESSKWTKWEVKMLSTKTEIARMLSVSRPNTPRSRSSWLRAPNIQDLLGTSRVTYTPSSQTASRQTCNAADKENENISLANTSQQSQNQLRCNKEDIERTEAKRTVVLDMSESLYEKKLRVQASERHDEYMRRLHKLSLMRPLVPRDAGKHPNRNIDRGLPTRPGASRANLAAGEEGDREAILEAKAVLGDAHSTECVKEDHVKEAIALLKKLETAEQSNRTLQVRLSDMSEMYAMLQGSAGWSQELLVGGVPRCWLSIADEKKMMDSAQVLFKDATAQTTTTADESLEDELPRFMLSMEALTSSLEAYFQRILEIQGIPELIISGSDKEVKNQNRLRKTSKLSPFGETSSEKNQEISEMRSLVRQVEQEKDEARNRALVYQNQMKEHENLIESLYTSQGLCYKDALDFEKEKCKLRMRIEELQEQLQKVRVKDKIRVFETSPRNHFHSEKILTPGDERKNFCMEKLLHNVLAYRSRLTLQRHLFHWYFSVIPSQREWKLAARERHGMRGKGGVDPVQRVDELSLELQLLKAALKRQLREASPQAGKLRQETSMRYLGESSMEDESSLVTVSSLSISTFQSDLSPLQSCGSSLSCQDASFDVQVRLFVHVEHAEGIQTDSNSHETSRALLASPL
eukprot:768513-Hanusia_phi.AAC.6